MWTLELRHLRAFVAIADHQHYGHAAESLRLTQPAITQRIQVLERSGTSVGLRRLAEDATAFYRVSGGAWRKLAAQAQIAAGQPACTETIMDGSNLLAIRVSSAHFVPDSVGHGSSGGHSG